MIQHKLKTSLPKSLKVTVHKVSVPSAVQLCAPVMQAIHDTWGHREVNQSCVPWAAHWGSRAQKVTRFPVPRQVYGKEALRLPSISLINRTDLSQTCSAINCGICHILPDSSSRPTSLVIPDSTKLFVTELENPHWILEWIRKKTDTKKCSFPTPETELKKSPCC